MAGRKGTVGVDQPRVRDADVLLAVAADLREVAAALDARPAVGSERYERLVARVRRGSEAARASAELQSHGVPERRLLATAMLGVIELELAGMVVEHQVGPIPFGIDAGVVGSLEHAVAALIDNVGTHARARSAAVSVLAGGSQVVLVVSDDGCGFDVDDIEQPGGRSVPGSLRTIRTRVEELGGTLHIASGLGAGTRVEITCGAPAGGRQIPCTW